MTKIIFMDVDGPMIPNKAYYLPNQTKPASVFDPCATGMINQILEDDPTVQIVISSIWGQRGYGRVERLLSDNGIDPKRMHADWITPREDSHIRTIQIKQWLDQHREVTQWCAIDDELLDSVVLPNFVQCDTYNGMSMRNYLECRYYLELTNPVGPGNDELNRTRHSATIEMYKRYELIRTTRRGEAKHDVATQTAYQLFPTTEVNNEDC